MILGHAHTKVPLQATEVWQRQAIRLPCTRQTHTHRFYCAVAGLGQALHIVSINSMRLQLRDVVEGGNNLL